MSAIQTYLQDDEWTGEGELVRLTSFQHQNASRYFGDMTHYKRATL